MNRFFQINVQIASSRSNDTIEVNLDTYLARVVVLEAEPHQVKVAIDFSGIPRCSGCSRGSGLARLHHASSSLPGRHGVLGFVVCSEASIDLMDELKWIVDGELGRREGWVESCRKEEIRHRG